MHISIGGDDGPERDEASECSVETRPSDCVDVNLWDRDPVYEDPGGGGVFTNLGVLIESVWGASRVKRGVCL